MQNAGPFALALVITAAACGGGGGTPPPPPPTQVFTSLSVSPSNPALVDGDVLQLTATPRDQNGAAMTGLGNSTFTLAAAGDVVSLTTAGLVTARKAGTATITASLTAGGITKTGNSIATVTQLSLTASVTASGAGQTFSPDTSKIAVNGTVEWSFPGPNVHNVTFSSPPAPVANIPARSSGSESRAFATAGTYRYQCTLHTGMDGAVIVRQPTP